MPNTGNIRDASESDRAIKLSTYNSMAEVTRKVLRESLDPAFFRVMDMGALSVISLVSRSTEAKQQFWPTIKGGASVTVKKGWVSVAGRGRWSVPETTVTPTGASGWVMVRKAKANPAASPFIAAAPIDPNPVQDAYYEWSICSYTINATSGKYTIADYSVGEKEWYATL